MRRIIHVAISIVFILSAASLYGQVVKRPRTQTFGGAAPAAVSRAQSASNEIAFDIDLGMVHSRELKGRTDLPTFSIVNWTGSNGLPKGASITTVAEPGMPEIPYLILTVAIPANASGFAAFTSGEKTSTLTQTYLPPRPYQVNDTTLELRYDAARYKTSVTSKVHVGPPARFRALRMIGLRIPLANFDAQKGIVKARTKFRCGIRYTLPPASKGVAAKPMPDPYMASLYEQAVINTSDIKAFSVPLKQKKASQIPLGFDGERTFDTTVTGWIDRDAQYIKITATRTGMYRMTAEELSTSGLLAGDWIAGEVRLINKGKEVPIWVEATSNGRVEAIEFYGERLAGVPGEYYNWSSDSNAYWLTNSVAYPNAPKRFLTRTIGEVPGDVIGQGTVTLHHERDYFYFGGDQVTDESTTLHRTDWIPDERFMWRTLREEVNTDIVDTFVVGKLPPVVTGKMAEFSVYVKGISRNSDPTDAMLHKCELRLNGAKVSEVIFTDYNDTLHTFSVPMDQIREGANSFVVAYAVIDPGAIDHWYLDRYTVTLPLGLAASQDTAIVGGQWNFTAQSEAPSATLQIVSGAEPGMYNLTDTVKLVSTGNTGGTVSFRDSVGSTGKRYVGSTGSSYLKPARISAWNIPSSAHWNDILDTAQGADYIIITHPEFLAPSKTLAARRAAAGLRIKVVTTDEIYNTFNYGSDEPMAIRSFLHYAFDFYKGTPPAFVTIMGDATFDPKFNLSNPLEKPENHTIHRNFVHSYGVPSSDAVYTFLEGHEAIDSLNQDMVITRLPVESVKEAENFLSKLEEYESRPPEEWNRHMLFTIGGTYKYENDGFWSYLDQFFNLNEWGGVRNSPLGINTTVISRTDFTEGVGIDKSHVGELQSEFREGKSLVYFFGHGATFITDLFYGDPGLYRNKGLYPVFITLSCRTGAYAEPNQITLNEAFLRQPDGGVVMAFGTTGFGEVLYDRNLTGHIFKILREDTVGVRQPASGPHLSNMAAVFTLAKFKASVIDGVGGALSDSWYNSLHQYSVLGDAAMGFVLRPQPEFNVAASEVALTDSRGDAKTVFSVTDSFVTVRAKVHNFGRVAENEVHVSIVNVQPKKEIVMLDTLARLDSSETITVRIPLDTFAIGTNQLRIKIDNDELYPETEERDNEAILTFQVSGFSATPFFPPEGAKNFCDASGDSVRFVLLLPSPTTISGSSTVEIQVDESSDFANPVSLGSFAATGSFFERSVLKSTLPSPASGVIWWRTRMTIGANQPTPWSESSANIGASDGLPMFSYSTGDQLERTIVSGLTREGDDALVIPRNDTIIWNVVSSAHKDTNANGNAISQILADRRPLKIFTKNGILVAPLTPDSANLDDVVYEFINTMTFDSAHDAVAGAQLTKSFDSVIALLPEGRKVIVLGNLQPYIEFFTRTQTVTDALKSLGSRNGFDSLEYFGSFAMIGTKGAAPGTAKERFGMSGRAGAQVFDTLVVAGTSGSARMPFTFVANSYGKLTWKATELSDDSSSLILNVLGLPRDGGQLVVLKSIPARYVSAADLSDIDARQFPRITIEARLNRTNDVVSPRLYGIEYEYAPAPEFVVEENAIFVEPAEVEEGNPVSSLYTVRNLLCIDGANVPHVLIRSNQTSSDTLSSESIAVFAGRSAQSFDDTVQTFGNEGRVRLTAIINPGGQVNEQLLFNNASSTFFDVRRDSSKPMLDVFFDEHHIQNGDYVSPKVQIAMRLFDESPVRVKDSLSIGGFLRSFDGLIDLITLDATKPHPDYNIQFIVLPSGSLQAELLVSPKVPFAAGRYGLTAFAFDGSGNPSDTLEYEFVISDKQAIENVMNYPNPFTDVTAFTFVLHSAVTSDVNVYVYTTAGRRIRTLTLAADKTKAGVNSVEWDGLNESGSDVANGTYLYKVVLSGKNEDGSDASNAVFEKAVRSR